VVKAPSFFKPIVKLHLGKNVDGNRVCGATVEATMPYGATVVVGAAVVGATVGAAVTRVSQNVPV